MFVLHKTSLLLTLSVIFVVALVMPAQAAVNHYSDRTAFEAVSDNRLAQGFEGEVWDGGDQVPPGFGWYGWYVPYYSGGVYPNGQQPPIPASAGLATTDAVTVGSYNNDQRNSLSVFSSTYGSDYGSGNYVMWAKLPDIPNPDGQQNYLRIGLSPGSSAVGMDFMGGVTVEVKVFSGTTLLDTQTVVVDPSRSFVGFISDAGAITGLEVRLGGSSTAGFMDNLTWGSLVSRTISGSISLENYGGNMSDIALRIELLQGGSLLRTDCVMVDADGAFSVDVPSGVYDVRFKTYTSLAEKQVGVDVRNAGADLGTITLKNGDADGDNAVTTTDLSTVLTAAQSLN